VIGPIAMRILITGSNSGFGKLASLTLARQGHHVIATMRSLDKSEALRAEAAVEDLDIEMRQLDVCDPGSIAGALGDAADIDVLVNNAGFEVQGALEMIDDELMHRQLDTNVLGPLRMIRSVMPAWRERGHGVIVNVSSVVGRATSPFGGAYAASKHALEAMSEALHWEASSAGIRVRVIEPGRFPTTDFGSNIVRPDGWEGSAFEAKALSLREALTSLDSGEPSDPQAVADAIAFAATDPEAPFRTVVGDDANLILGAKTSMSFEDFEQAMRSTINWYE
jgi:NAD(P)-dependent dehydrogenase (short-subunit alcohol dehydrogenase family)